MKEKLSSVTTAVLVKSYVGVSIALSVTKRRKQDKKRDNDFKIRSKIASNKLSTNGINTEI